VRVLHVHSGNLWGGVESMLLTIAREEARTTGMRSEFALCVDGEFASALRMAGAPVHALGVVRTSRPWTVWRARRRLDEVLAERRPDVTVVHSAWSAAIFGPALATLGAPYVAWVHAPAGGPWWQRALASRHRPSVVVCNSHYTCRSGKTGDGIRTAVIYCPVAPPEPRASRHQTRAALGVPHAGTAVIAMAARMEAWKGHRLLLAALGRLGAGGGWTCWIAGGGQTPAEQSYEGALRRETAAAGLRDNVRFLGRRGDVADLLAAADIYCQPNLGGEPFGIAFVEALWAGLPVVTTDLGAAPEVVDDRCGRLVPPNDEPALATTLAALISDTDLRRRLGEHGPVRAASLCAPATQLASIESLFASL
jgi:glycosyltransferase involved in cell wall biosynthesis